jgi:ketosteroid isomerase-like protein
MFALCALLSPGAWAASADEDLIALLDEFLAGASNNDLAAHERFWSEDLVYTSSTGARFGKAEIIGPLQDGTASDAEDEDPTVYGREALLVRVYGDTAVVTFRLVGTSQSEPASVTRYYNTGTFLLRNGEWRAIAWQATRIPADA